MNNKLKHYIKNIIENYKNYKDYWNYEDGCILSGCREMYEASGEPLYCEFILKYLSSLIDDEGTILNYDNSKHSIDSFNSGKILFFAYDITGDEKYRRATEFLWERLKNYPRTSEGNFIHKSIYPGQVWLDGLYMAQPFYAAYEKYFGDRNYSDILNQFINVREHMFIEEKSLYCHGYDTEKIQSWADKKSGLSESFWLRAAGWYVMALVDIIAIIDNSNDPCSRKLTSLYSEAIEGLLRYADSDTGLFYQVIDRGGDRRNYTETSGSLMISYSLMKSIFTDIPENKTYFIKGKEIFERTVSEKLIRKDDGFSLKDICCSAGLGPGEDRNGSPEYYFSEKIVSDDPKGAGVLMMAYSQIIRMSRRMQHEVQP